MKVFKLSGEVRTDLGKKASKAIRKENKIPAVIYGGEETKHIVLTQEGVRKLIFTPDIYLVELTLEGKAINCIIKEIQFHPVTDKILHIDLLEVFENKPIVMNVPVELTGHAAGVRAGGKLMLQMRRLAVKAPYTEIPEKLSIDVTKLTLGKTMQVGDLQFEGLELMNAKNAVVCAVKLTRAAQGGATGDEEEHEEGEEHSEEGEEEKAAE